MIDTHCHILPSVDDGSRSLTESLAMAKEATRQGIHKIIATPHHNNGSFMNRGRDILGRVVYLNEKLEAEDIPIEILPGQEVRIYGEIMQDLQHGDILPLNESGFILIELPTSHVPQYTSQLLFDMQIAGYKPIIAHPERNLEIMENSDRLYSLVKNGALTQVTAASIVGNTGSKVQKFTYQILEANLAHFIASDAHNLKKRGFYMQEAYQTVKKEFGSIMAFQLMENGEAMISGSGIYMEEPERIKVKKLWGMLKK